MVVILETVYIIVIIALLEKNENRRPWAEMYKIK